MLKSRAVALIGLSAVIVGSCAACTPAGASTNLSSYDSLDDANKAVGELLDCAEKAPESTRVYNAKDLIVTNSIKCTDTVEVFHFDSGESKDETYSILADSEGTVHFAAGQNWFVVDYSETAATDGTIAPLDLEGLADELGAEYAEVK